MTGEPQQAEVKRDCPVCGLFFLDGWRYLAHLRSHWKRGAKLAPLEPNAFLRWAWNGEPGTTPITVEDLAFELRAQEPDVDERALRREYVSLAARVRRNQRLGLDPWEGVA